MEVASDKLQSYCIECQKMVNKENYEKNIKARQAKRLKWQDENRELHNRHVRDYYERKRTNEIKSS